MTIDDIKACAEQSALSVTGGRRIFCLVGELGSGKTAFSGFFLRALGVSSPVTSPTFVIMKKYPLPGPVVSLAYHVDCYRLKSSDELLALGFRDALRDPSAVILVEWADMVRDIMPPDAVWIDFSHTDHPDRRTVSFRP